MRFLTNTKNMHRIDGLVDDVHEALMAYQVCTLHHSLSTMSDIHARLHYSKMFMMRVVNSL